MQLRSDIPSPPRIEEYAWSGLVYRSVELDAPPACAFVAPRTECLRLTVLFEGAPGSAYCRGQRRPRGLQRSVENPMCLQPAGMETWLCSDSGGHFRGATLSFDRAAQSSGMFEQFELEKLTVPRMMFTNERLWRFARDLDVECRNPGQLTPLYRESLVTLLLIELVRSGVGRRQTGKLTPEQLKRVVECIEHSDLERLRLSELAALVGLSPSHFVQAFRRSTGMPPYRWQLASRVRKAQGLLLDGKLTVAEVALATGFVDQSHFTRTFRRFVGCTPAAWLRAGAR